MFECMSLTSLRYESLSEKQDTNYNSYLEFTRWHYYLEYMCFFLYFLKLSAGKGLLLGVVW